MKVDVSSSHPILRMEVDTDDFGRLFAAMAADEQVDVLRSIASHMGKHPIQWDYIAIELELEENENLFRKLTDIATSMKGEA